MIPEKLKINGKEFNIKPIEGVSTDAGNCDTDNLIIRINPALPRQQQESTLLHEIVEALNIFYELNLKHDIIVRLENGLYQVFHDNELKF